MSAVSLIHRYNRLNGNAIGIAKLKEFHQAVQRHLDSVGHGPFVPDLKAILERVAKVIKRLNAGEYVGVERLELVPIDTASAKEGKILRVSKNFDPEAQVKGGKQENLIAEEISLSKIQTDTKRFQNRTDAFSEASANSVAQNYDPNKFDPIVVWMDTKAKKLFVLSGHSRYEGMKRRGAKTIPVRYFKGTEDEAIKFARVEANRAANQENLIEDLAAYKMMRDGIKEKGIAKATKTELARIFKGKVQKLEAYSHLSTTGLFVQSLSQSNTSNFPYLERNAQWIGILRKEFPVISNPGEDNIFHFFYSDKSGKNIKLSKDDFFKLAKKKLNQLAKGESVLFPECSSEGCKAAVDKEADPQKGEAYKRLREINETLATIREKLTSKNANVRVTTDDEKKYLRATAEKLEAEKERIDRDLNLIDKSQASLFGMKGPQYDAFDIKPVKKHRGPLNKLQMEQLKDAIKAGRTPKVNLKAKMNAKKTDAPLFEPTHDPKQQSLFGKSKKNKVQTSKSLSGVNYQYKEIDLGPYKNDFHRMFSDTIVQIHGGPGHGKTVYLLKFGQYRASQNENVLYVAREEYGRSVLDMKLTEHNIGHANLRFTRELSPQDIAWANVIFLDSVQALKLGPGDIEDLSFKYPNKNWILVLQSTKDGDFRGSQEWEHLVDVAGEVVNRKLILHKNRLDPHNSAKAEKLLKENAIAEARKKAEIRKAVKADTKDPAPQPQQLKVA